MERTRGVEERWSGRGSLPHAEPPATPSACLIEREPRARVRGVDLEREVPRERRRDGEVLRLVRVLGRHGDVLQWGGGGRKA